VVDFGLLLNDWLSVSSAARLLARDAAVGMHTCTPNQCGQSQAQLWNEAFAQPIPGVTKDPYFGSRYCCDVPSGAPGDNGAAVQLVVTYYDQCTPQVSGCAALSDPTTLDSRFSSNGMAGTCTLWMTPPATPPNPPNPTCLHPVPPGKAGTCPLSNTGPGNPCPGDSVVVTLKAAGAQVITPLVRPFFGGPGCPDTSTPSRCYVPLTSRVAMRYEGDTVL
jgi:hypothetical protein